MTKIRRRQLDGFSRAKRKTLERFTIDILSRVQDQEEPKLKDALKGDDHSKWEGELQEEVQTLK